MPPKRKRGLPEGTTAEQKRSSKRVSMMRDAGGGGTGSGGAGSGGTGGASSSKPAVPKAQPKCFRIANIPKEWSENDLLDVLRTVDQSFRAQKHQLALYPACTGSTQTALLSLDACTDYFSPNTDRYEPVNSTGERPGTDLRVDDYFYNLTPLNNPGDKIVAELASTPSPAVGSNCY